MEGEPTRVEKGAATVAGLTTTKKPIHERKEGMSASDKTDEGGNSLRGKLVQHEIKSVPEQASRE